MRILVLTKRQYMGKDLLDDRFGRFRELPLELAKLGHDVIGICLSYRPKEEGVAIDTEPSGSRITWHSLNLGRPIIPGLIKYFLHTNKLAKEFHPDLIWACSDSFHAILGVWLARLSRTKCVVDLYDHFEAFPATRFTGLSPLFKRAVRTADGVTCFSTRLADRVVHVYERRGPTTVLENGVRADLFYPQDRRACRQRLGLPEDAKIIGTAGALHETRGIQALFDGFKILASKTENLHLAIAGPRPRWGSLPKGPRVHDLGVLPLEKVPLLINALDVAVVCYRDSRIGQYSFPQKAYEILACCVPMVAATVGAMKDLLRCHPECLFEPESPESFAKTVRSQLTNPTIIDLNVPSWADIARRLETFLGEIISPEVSTTDL